MPPPALVETPGAANANTYATLAEANVYISSRLNTTQWDAASNDTKNAALLQAARLLDSVMCWTGEATDDVQALTWPRTGMYSRNGVAIASTVIPQALKDAQSELARQLHLNDITATNEVIAQGITEVKAGPVAVKFGNTLLYEGSLVNPTQLLPTSVVNLLVPSWICDDWVNAQTPPERHEFEFTRFDTDTDLDVDE